MLSVGLGEDEASRYLENLTQGQAIIACINSPNSVTVSGDVDAIYEVYTRIVARGDETFCRKLLVDTAYHSHHMRAAADEYRPTWCRPPSAHLPSPRLYSADGLDRGLSLSLSSISTIAAVRGCAERLTLKQASAPKSIKRPFIIPSAELRSVLPIAHAPR